MDEPHQTSSGTSLAAVGSVSAAPVTREFIGRARDRLSRVARLLAPATRAAIETRIATWERLFEQFAARAPRPPSTTAARPRRLPRPLNPFFFVRRDRAPRL